MNIRNKIRILLRYISIFILASCSKTSNNHGVIPTEFTYTVTTKTATDVTFSGNTTNNSDSDKYAAWITPPDTGNHQLLNFSFLHTNVYRNSLTFSLPYFQASLSETDTFLKSPLTLEFYRTFYVTARPAYPTFRTEVYLSRFSISTNISDSTNGFVTGSFNISATTEDSAKILVSGKFSHLPSNYTPR